MHVVYRLSPWAKIWRVLGYSLRASRSQKANSKERVVKVDHLKPTLRIAVPARLGLVGSDVVMWGKRPNQIGAPRDVWGSSQSDLVCKNSCARLLFLQTSKAVAGAPPGDVDLLSMLHPCAKTRFLFFPSSIWHSRAPRRVFQLVVPRSHHHHDRAHGLNGPGETLDTLSCSQCHYQ